MSEHEALGKLFSRGGYIPGKPTTVTARRVDGRYEYWEPELNRWVPVLTP